MLYLDLTMLTCMCLGESEAPSAVFGSELASNYLDHYGLDGPLPAYQPPSCPPSRPPSVAQLPVRVAAGPPPASVTSLAAKKKKQQEAKQATIR